MSATVQIVSNGRIVASPTYPFDYHNYGDADLVWLRAYAVTNNIFSGVDLTLPWKDREIDMIDAITGWSAETLNWTGSDTGGPFLGRAKTILEYHDTEPDPETYSCGTLAYACIGLAQAHGIPARILHGHNSVAGADNILEYWSLVYGRWIASFNHTKGYFKDGRGRLGAWEIKVHDDAGRNLKTGATLPLVHCPSESNRYGIITPSADTKWWEGYFSNATVATVAKRNQASGESEDYVKLSTFIHSDLSGEPRAVSTIEDDTNAPLSQCVATVTESYPLVCTMSNNMKDFVNYDVSYNSGKSWETLLLDGSNAFNLPTWSGPVWTRAAGLGGVQSNDVKLVVQGESPMPFPGTHNLARSIAGMEATILDPGSAGTIASGTGLFCRLQQTTGAAETRTLPDPQIQGQTICLYAETCDSTNTITVSGSFLGLAAGASTLVFDADDEFAYLKGVNDSATLKWMLQSPARAALVKIDDDGGYTTEADVEGAIQELYATRNALQFVPVPLTSFRIEETTGDPDIDVLANHGGILAADSTPSLTYTDGTGTDHALRVTWGATATGNIVAQIPLPPGLDTDENVFIRVVKQSSGSTDTRTMDADVWFDTGDTVVQGSATMTTSVTAASITIAAASVPANAATMTLKLQCTTDGTTDSGYLYSVGISYTQE